MDVSPARLIFPSLAVDISVNGNACFDWSLSLFHKTTRQFYQISVLLRNGDVNGLGPVLWKKSHQRKTGEIYVALTCHNLIDLCCFPKMADGFELCPSRFLISIWSWQMAFANGQVHYSSPLAISWTHFANSLFMPQSTEESFWWELLSFGSDLSIFGAFGCDFFWTTEL